VHVTELEPVQVPVWQVSACVQALLSSHAVPSGLAGFEQVPVVWSQTPGAWHWSDATQVTGVPLLHAPLPSQVSAPLQALPSPQEVPAAAGGLLHAPVDGLQVPPT
jgi:hypothetical protein